MDRVLAAKKHHEIFVKINKDRHGELEGCFTSFYLKEDVYFNDLGSMVLKIDQMLSDLPADPVRNFETYPVYERPQYFFLLDIKYRYNNSWQGVMRYSGSSGQVCFRSTLDLIREMTNIMKSQYDILPV